MLSQYRIDIHDSDRKNHHLWNALLALATGILTLIYPNFLYLIAGGYLIALGALFIPFRIPTPLAAVPIIAGIIILIFPELIPITFASFLGLFGLLLLLSFGFAFIGGLTLVIALLIIINPDSVGYLAATFLLLYSVSNLIRLYRG
jgi:hypothetical protein